MHDSLIPKRGDSLGDRMKGQYESRTRAMLPRRTYTLIRVDGKAFHTYTRNCQRPFDESLMRCMDYAAVELCREAQGAAFGYVQSDEISVLLTDFVNEQTDAWFDGNLQKICSISASCVTAYFNGIIRQGTAGSGAAMFDARAWTIPDPTEVANYFIWRQQDATRNSIQMLARCHYSHAELFGVNNEQIQEKLFQEKGINWNGCPNAFKRGRAIVRAFDGSTEGGWTVNNEIHIFTSDEGKDWLRRQIPRYE